MRILHSHLLLLLAALCALAAASETELHDELPTATLLTRADGLLSSGRGADALELYSVAVDRDRASYLNLYKRGTAHLALGHTHKALDDFEAVLALTEFDQARLQAARIQLRLGAYADALASLTTYLSRNAGSSQATELKKQLRAAEAASMKAEKSSKKSDWQGCVDQATEAIQVSSASTRLLELRSDCYLRLGRVEDAVGDLTRAVSLAPTNAELLARLSLLSTLYLNQAGSSAALAPLKQCLHFDPDSKPCKRLFRSLKSFDKDLSRARNFIESSSFRPALQILDPRGGGSGTEAKKSLAVRLQEILADYTAANAGASLPSEDVSETLTQLYGWTCKAHLSVGSVRLALPACKEVHRRDPDNVDGLHGLGDSALKAEEYEEAVHLLGAAFEKSGRSSQAILDKLQKAQRLLKQSKAKDYYKVLGVSRDADAATIRKAYRRKTKESHPDKEGGSEKAMAAVNEAYEVLKDDELRRRYDNGDDPNDPMSGHQQQGGGNPFFHHGGGGGGQQFFHQFFQQGAGGGNFPGGGGQFKFHFGG